MGSACSKSCRPGAARDKAKQEQDATKFTSQGLSSWDADALRFDSLTTDPFERKYTLPVAWRESGSAGRNYAVGTTQSVDAVGTTQSVGNVPPLDAASPIEFALNGKRVVLSASDDPQVTLLSYLREHTSLTGTKRVCEQGGCGACTVTLARRDDQSGHVEYNGVNACLVTLASIDGAAVTTTEGLGCTRDGLHPVQQRIVDFNGSQCGFCTPGMVMSTYSRLKEHECQAATGEPTPSLVDIEMLDNNLCRCTGYRPLLNACRSFAAPSEHEALAPLCYGGHESYTPEKTAPRHKPIVKYDPHEADPMFPTFLDARPSLRPLAIPSHCEGGHAWHRAVSLADAAALLTKHAGRARLMVGNTTRANDAWVKSQPETVLVDVTAVPELAEARVADGRCFIGGAVTISACIRLLETSRAALSAAQSAAFPSLIEHLGRIGGRNVRNQAGAVGNLVLAKFDSTLGSDFAVLMAALPEATMHLVDAPSPSSTRKLPFWEWLTEPWTAAARQQIIVGVSFALGEAGDRFQSFKVAQRGQNCGALVNAAFSLRGEGRGATLVVGSQPARGGGTLNEWRATRAEAMLLEQQAKGRFEVRALTGALKAQLIAECYGGDVSGEKLKHSRARVQLACNLLAKFVASLQGSGDPAPAFDAMLPDGCDDRTQDVVDLNMPQKGGPPIHAPITKLTAPLQATGALKYAEDVDAGASLCHAAYVTSPIACGTVQLDRDKVQALVSSTAGFIALLDASDIPGNNNVSTASVQVEDIETLFAPNGKVLYHGQALALVVADSLRVARSLARTLSEEENGYLIVERAPAILTLRDAIEQKSFWRPSKLSMAKLFFTFAMVREGIEADDDGNPLVMGSSHGDPERVLNSAVEEGEADLHGELDVTPSQKHFYMERQTALAVPEENEYGGGTGATITCSTQNLLAVKQAVAEVLGVTQNLVRVKQTHAGGAFGGKLTRCNHVAAAAALGAARTHRPCRLVLDLATDMQLTGSRFPTLMRYKLRCLPSGKITALVVDVYMAQSKVISDFAAFAAQELACLIQSVYELPNLDVNVRVAAMNISINTACRAPGSPKASLLINTVMAHVAYATGRPLLSVMEANFPERRAVGLLQSPAQKGHFFEMWRELSERVRFDHKLREVAEWNRSHRTLKRGVSLTPGKFTILQVPGTATVQIHYGGGSTPMDGSITIHTNGCEIGQGLHTKVVQTASAILSKCGVRGGVPIDLIRVAPTDTGALPNPFLTGTSSTSEAACAAVADCCEELLAKLSGMLSTTARLASFVLDGVSQGLQNVKSPSDMTWPEYVASVKVADFVMLEPLSSTKHYVSGIATTRGFRKLVTSSINNAKDFDVMGYDVFSCGFHEVAVDVSTGETAILRADLLYDAGASLNPVIDLGQIQGGYMMAVGHILREKQAYDEATGKDGSNTFNYKPPSASDVPRVFNVQFYKGLPNAGGTFGSKAVAEPPMLLAGGLVPAIRMAVESARQDHALTGWYELPVPVCPLDIVACSGFDAAGAGSGSEGDESSAEAMAA